MEKPIDGSRDRLGYVRQAGTIDGTRKERATFGGWAGTTTAQTDGRGDAVRFKAEKGTTDYAARGKSPSPE